MLLKEIEKEKSLFYYRGSIPEILRYQVVTKVWLLGIAWIFHAIRGALLWTSDRSAITSGDLGFLLHSVQGWLLLVLGFGVLIVYALFDINAMILLSSRILHQQPVKIRDILKESLVATKYFRNVSGVLLLLYVAFLVPVIGVGIGLSLTNTLYVPDFITSVIYANTLYRVFYSLGILVLMMVTVYYVFTFHCVIIGHLSARQARIRAGQLMKKNWRNFLVRYTRFLLRTLGIGVGIGLSTMVLLGMIAVVSKFMSVVDFRTYITLFAYVVVSVVQIYWLVFTPFQIMALTRIYESYTEEDEGEQRYPKRKHHYYMWILGITYCVGLCVVSVRSARDFDVSFPTVGKTEVVAHRAGGNLGNENTVYGLQQAIKAGAMAGEIDVQRTLDGQYVINHDTTLFRLAGERKTVSELTLAQIKKLSVPDYFNLFDKAQPFATLEEMLDTAKDNIHLYIELKGSGNDTRMAEEVYQIVCEKGMLDQVTFICLKYPTISYLELQHPEAHTGYLCFAAIGELAYLDVDELILEEETATVENINRIHEAGKKVSVWTVNQPLSMLRFFSRNVDGVISDEVDDCLEVKRLLNVSFDSVYARQLDDFKRVILHLLFAM